MWLLLFKPSVRAVLREGESRGAAGPSGVTTCRSQTRKAGWALSWLLYRDEEPGTWEESPQDLGGGPRGLGSRVCR